MASSQESMSLSIQSQLKGQISNKLKEHLQYTGRYHWDHVNSLLTNDILKIGGRARKDFQEVLPPMNVIFFKAALVYIFKREKHPPQRWVFAWKSPPPELGPNKVFTKLYDDKTAINWDEIEQVLEHCGTIMELSEDTQDGVRVRFAAPKNGNIGFFAEIEYAPK